MRTLITGINGFIATWLSERLRQEGDEVLGFSRRDHGDISDGEAVLARVREARPDRVFHLAALNNIADSFADPQKTVDTNVTGSLNVLNSVHSEAPGATVISVGSSSEYGRTCDEHDLVQEDMPLQPKSPYGWTKAMQGHLTQLFAERHGLRAVHVRPFAIIGPRKERDALSDFSSAVARIERGEESRLRVGNLDAVRDFVDVRDAVSALVLISDKGEPGSTYNLCHGVAGDLHGVIDQLLSLAVTHVEVETDPARLRPSDDQRIVGDPSRLDALGYRPRYSLNATVEDTLGYWRQRGHHDAARGNGRHGR